MPLRETIVMMKGALALGLVFAIVLSTTAHAEPAQLGWFGDLSIGAAALHQETTSPINGYHDVRNALVLDGRGALGLTLGRPSGAVARVGVVVDVAKFGSYGVAIGVAGEIDWVVAAGWRLGPRVSLSAGNGNGEPSSFDGTVGMAGLHAEHRFVSLQLDAIRVWHPDGYAAGAALSVGLAGRPGKYAAVGSAIGAAVVAVALLILLLNCHCG